MAHKLSTAVREARRTERDEVHFRTWISSDAFRRAAALVVDVSCLGFMARCDAAFEPGDTITIGLPTLGPISARIIWALGGRVGCEFAAPLSPQDYTTQLGAMRSQGH
ncbi:MAG: PilZ domain-containing protein [Sphingomonas sp.]